MVSVNFNLASVPLIVISPPYAAISPVVVIFCDPKSGEIFVPAIAAFEATFALSIKLVLKFPLESVNKAPLLTILLGKVRV